MPPCGVPAEARCRRTCRGSDRLRHLLLQLRRMQFGPRSERLPEEQLQLGLEALEQAIAKEDAEAEKRDLELGRDTR
jgi:transposase